MTSTGWNVPPSAFATSAPADVGRSRIAIDAPFSCSSSAVARAMPDAPPTMTAFLPLISTPRPSPRMPRRTGSAAAVVQLRRFRPPGASRNPKHRRRRRRHLVRSTPTEYQCAFVIVRNSSQGNTASSGLRLRSRSPSNCAPNSSSRRRRPSHREERVEAEARPRLGRALDDEGAGALVDRDVGREPVCVEPAQSRCSRRRTPRSRRHPGAPQCSRPHDRSRSARRARLRARR